MANEITLPSIYQGQSPLTQAAIASFNQATLPVIQNQMALQGLSNSPALGMATGSALAQALPQFIMGGEQLNQSGAKLMADIANLQQQGAYQGNQQMLQALGGLGQTAGTAAGAQNQQLQTALGALGGAGQLQQNTVQQALDNAQLDFLRRQGLAEQSSTGIFGGSVVSPTVQQAAKTTSASSK